MLTNHDKQATENREPADETNKEDPTQGILVRFQPFTDNQDDLETHVLAHSSERENSEFGRCGQKNGKHSVFSNFPKDGNFDKPKLRGFLSKDAIRDLFHVQKSLVT